MRGISLPRQVILVLFIFCIAITALNVIPAGAQSPCGWTEYSNNPVLGQWLGEPNRAYYPKVIYDLGHFSGHGDNAYYKMWFNTYIGGAYSIRYAYSDNGTNWTEPTNPVNGLAPSSGHPLVKYDPNGFGGGAYYKIWYWIGNQTNTINDLRYAESDNGTTWYNDQPLTQDGTSPLVTGTWPDWNEISNGPCDLIYNSNGSNTLDDGNLWNNKYVLYYMGNNGNNEYIGLAYSANGTHWKRYGDQPVLEPCTTTDNSTMGWDFRSVGYCSVMKISDIWQMWYGGGPGTNEGIGYATSDNGTYWIKYPNNPIFHISDNIPWRNQRTYTPWVVYDAGSFSPYGDAYPFKMWFTGVSSNGLYSIGYAYALAVMADAGPDQTIISGGSTVIGGSPTASGGIPPYAYNWSPAAGLDNPASANPTASPTTTTIYSVTVTDSKGCSGSDNMTLFILPPSPVGGGGGGLVAEAIACPLGLVADMEGTTTIASMSGKGTLCETCIARDTSGKYVLQLDKDTQLTLPGNAVPLLLTFRQSSTPPPAPENTVIVGSAYEISAYPTSYATVPLPVTISPPAKLTLTYDPEKLPRNATEVFIANYDATKGWLALTPVPGVVAELGKVQGLASHFSPIAVLARLAEPIPAKFEVSSFAVSPHQVRDNQEVKINIKVTNTGEISGDYSLQLKVDGILKSSKQVTVPGGTSQVVNFTTTGYTAGKHKVEVADLSGEFEIIGTSQSTSTNLWFVVGAVVILLLMAVVLFALRR